MQVLSSVFSTLLVFNLIIANRVLGEAVTPPKVAGALLILAGAGITTGATPQGVPKAYTPQDVRELFFAPPPYGWFVPLLFGACVLVSVVGILLVERRFPLGAEGELEPELICAIESRMSVGPGGHTLCTRHADAMHTPCTRHAHAMPMPCYAMAMPCTCRHRDLGPTGDIGQQLQRSLSPHRKSTASRERWNSSRNSSADSNSSAWRAFMEGSSVASEAGVAGVAGVACVAGVAGEAGTSSEVAPHDCSVETAANVLPPPSPRSPPEHPLPPTTPPPVHPKALRLIPSPVPRSHRRSHPMMMPPQLPAPTPPVAGPRLVLPSGSPVWTSYGRQPEPPPAVAPAASPRVVTLPPAAPTTPRMQPSSSSHHVRPPPEPRSCARRADAPSEGSAAQPAARPPFAWLLGARTPRPLPAWAGPLVATGYAAALGLDEALADLCVRAYSSMLTTCDRPAAGCWDGWALYVFALVGTAAGLASALFYMPLVYRRYETTARHFGTCNAPTISILLVYYYYSACDHICTVG